MCSCAAVAAKRVIDQMRPDATSHQQAMTFWLLEAEMVFHGACIMLYE